MEHVKPEIQFDEKEVKDGAPFAALSYVGVLWILTFILKKDNRFAIWHARQGIVVFLVFVVGIVAPILPLVGGLINRVSMLVWVVLSIYGIYLSLTGKTTPIPVVSDVAEKLVV